MKKYDVIIIGAGPCGIACAIELGKKNRNILVLDEGNCYNDRSCEVDAGQECVDCWKCNVISGFGGCIHYGDSIKLSYYPSGKALYNKLGEKSYYELLQRACTYWNVDADKDFIKPELRDVKERFEIKNYPVCTMDSVKVKAVIEKWHNIIQNSASIDLQVRKEMTEIRPQSHGFELHTADHEVYYASKIVMAVGRGGMLWLKENLHGLGGRTTTPISSIGLRFEIPKTYIKELGSRHPDLKIRKQFNDRKYKTFCFCAGENGGRIKFINYGRYVLLDGHVLTDKDMDSTVGNFALLTQIPISKDGGLTHTEHINSILEKYIAVNGGKPICQSFLDFKNKRSFNKKYSDNTGNIGNIPYKDVHTLLEDEVDSFCYVAEEIFHYILEGTDVVYEDFLQHVKVIALELEGLWDKVETNDEFETTCENLYIGGDCGGETQGIMQATMMGIRIADAIGKCL